LEFLFFIAVGNELRQQHISQLGLKLPADAELEGIRHIYIFSISFKVLQEEMSKWKWDAPYLESALASSLKIFFIILTLINKHV
jgi:hypothetical protein